MTRRLRLHSGHLRNGPLTIKRNHEHSRHPTSLSEAIYYLPPNNIQETTVARSISVVECILCQDSLLRSTVQSVMSSALLSTCTVFVPTHNPATLY